MDLANAIPVDLTKTFGVVFWGMLFYHYSYLRQTAHDNHPEPAFVIATA